MQHPASPGKGSAHLNPRQLLSLVHHRLPCDCEDGPEEPINLGDGPREDIADAMDSGHLGVLLQRLHQRAGLAHDHAFLLQLLDSN